VTYFALAMAAFTEHNFGKQVRDRRAIIRHKVSYILWKQSHENHTRQT